MFEVKQLICICCIGWFIPSCNHQGEETVSEPFTTEIDSSLFQRTSLNEVSFLVPKEMTPIEADNVHCEFSILHREEHLIFSQTPCDQIFESDENLKSYVDYFLDKNKKSDAYYELQSVDSVLFKGDQAFVVCYLDKPYGFPSITHNECFFFKNANKFNVLHTWSLEEMDSSLINKSKYTFDLK